MTRVSSRRNGARGANDERRAAEDLGGLRHWANSGRHEDVAHQALAIQVKGGKTVTTTIMRAGLDAAQLAAVGTAKVPCLYIVDRSGTRVRRLVVFEVDQLCQWLGWPKPEWLTWKADNALPAD